MNDPIKLDPSEYVLMRIGFGDRKVEFYARRHEEAVLNQIISLRADKEAKEMVDEKIATIAKKIIHNLSN